MCPSAGLRVTSTRRADWLELLGRGTKVSEEHGRQNEASGQESPPAGVADVASAGLLAGVRHAHAVRRDSCEGEEHPDSQTDESGHGVDPQVRVLADRLDGVRVLLVDTPGSVHCSPP